MKKLTTITAFGVIAGVMTAVVSAPSVAAPSTVATHDARHMTTTVAAPGAGITALKVVRYRGKPDDRKGTKTQDRGLATAPYGGWGGVRPGQVGNYFVAAHRSSAGGPMRNVPNLRAGDKIQVREGRRTYTYTVAYTLWINFRKAASRKLQMAPVPGRPGVRPTRPALVLSTCATPEDKRAGLKWKDSNGNSTHRISVVAFM